MSNGKWTTYAKTASLKYAIPGETPTARPTAFWVALFTDSADPANTNTEVAVTGYSRQAVNLALGGISAAANDADVDLSGMDPVTIGGVAVFDDDTAGNKYFWWDLDTPLVTTAGVIIPMGEMGVEGDES